MERTGTKCNVPGLAPVLEKWTALMDMDDPKASWGGRDAPWWYSERASVSQFAGAIWTSGGWCFEEFRVALDQDVAGDPHSAHGRCDLAFEVGGTKAIVEAKIVWPTKLSPKAVHEAIQLSLKGAAEQVRRYSAPEGYERLVVCFAAPSLAAAPTDAKLEELIGALDGCVAWAFPRATQGMSSSLNGRFYPGVVLRVAVANEVPG